MKKKLHSASPARRRSPLPMLQKAPMMIKTPPMEKSPRKEKFSAEKSVNESEKKKKTAGRTPPLLLKPKDDSSISRKGENDSSKSSEQSLKAVQKRKTVRSTSRRNRNGTSNERTQKSEEEDITTAKNRTFDDNESKADNNSSAAFTGSLQITIENMKRSLKHFAMKCKRITMDELTEQYYKLPEGRKEECKTYLDPKNRTKNRYANIYCLEKSRVLLHFLKEDGTYIHANRVQYPTLKNQFIMTQGPLTTTLADFWRMVWQEKSENIVMLCNLRENGRPKSTEYFGQQLDTSAIYGQITVKTCMRDYDDGLVITRLEITWNKNTRTIMHYHMTDWRDCRAPVVCVRQMFQLLSAIRTCPTPTIVHCSAGVGRSGTFVALEMCLMDVAHGRVLDIFEIVKTLRSFRCCSVQTFEQYLALHKFVLQFGEQNDCITREETQNFYRLFDNYSKDLP